MNILLLPLLLISASQSAITRHDFFINSDPGVRLFVREVNAEKNGSGKPILLLHGARVPGIASFDLPVPRRWMSHPPRIRRWFAPMKRCATSLLQSIGSA